MGFQIGRSGSIASINNKPMLSRVPGQDRPRAHNRVPACRRVLVANNRKIFASAQRRKEHIGHQVRFGFVVLAAFGSSAGSVKIAQGDKAQAIGAFKSRQRAVDE